MNVSSEFLARSRHYLAYEYPAKIRQCLDVLPADALWRRAGESSNSIGNLLLHLRGNVRQWIVSAVGGAADDRNRAEEFATVSGENAEALFGALRTTLDDTDGVLARLTPDDLATRRTIQGRDVSVFEAVYHVVEHFSTHTGQIILLTKMHAPDRIHFYADAGGLATPRWRDNAPLASGRNAVY